MSVEQMAHLSDLFIEHDSLVSLHVQLHNQMRRLILSGRWAYGTRIPTESQLATHLNISRSTVRLALHMAEVEGLIERTRGRGTFVSNHARPANRLLAFVSTDFNTDYQLLILKGAECQARATGYRIIFSHSSSHEEELRVLDTLQADAISGLILWPRPLAGQGTNQTVYKRLIVPTVLLDRPIPGLDFPCVTSDNYNGALSLVQHLVELGHRNIVFLCHHQLHLLPVADRLRAYNDALTAAGIAPPEPWLIGVDDDEIGSHYILKAYDKPNLPLIEEIQRLLIQHQPTAIFAVHDHLAVMAALAMRQLGLRIPQDISVAGFDDADLSVYMSVPLTTVAQDTLEIGRRAAQLLINQIENPGQIGQNQFVPTQLRVRASTAVFTASADIERG